MPVDVNPGTRWLLDETVPLSRGDAQEAGVAALRFEGVSAAPLAVILKRVAILDTGKWFGSAEIRLDALFVSPSHENPVYQPLTLSFPGVKDGDILPIGESGVALYHGTPQYFLDIAIIASRAKSDSKDLSVILAERANDLGDLLGNVAKLTFAVPQAAAILAASSAAAKLASAALQFLDQVTGNSIGLYRTTWFEHRDRFGIGSHPESGGMLEERGLSFNYEIFQDTPSRTHEPAS